MLIIPAITGIEKAKKMGSAFQCRHVGCPEVGAKLKVERHFLIAGTRSHYVAFRRSINNYVSSKEVLSRSTICDIIHTKLNRMFL